MTEPMRCGLRTEQPNHTITRCGAPSHKVVSEPPVPVYAICDIHAEQMSPAWVRSRPGREIRDPTPDEYSLILASEVMDQ